MHSLCNDIVLQLVYVETVTKMCVSVSSVFGQQVFISRIVSVAGLLCN